MTTLRLILHTLRFLLADATLQVLAVVLLPGLRIFEPPALMAAVATAPAVPSGVPDPDEPIRPGEEYLDEWARTLHADNEAHRLNTFEIPDLRWNPASPHWDPTSLLQPATYHEIGQPVATHYDELSRDWPIWHDQMEPPRILQDMITDAELDRLLHSQPELAIAG